MNNIPNLLSFDLEYCFSNEFINNNANNKDLTEKPVIAILELLKHHNTKATFFVVGERLCEANVT